MNRHDFINQALSTLNAIEYNVSKTGFLMRDDEYNTLMVELQRFKMLVNITVK